MNKQVLKSYKEAYKDINIKARCKSRYNKEELQRLEAEAGENLKTGK